MRLTSSTSPQGDTGFDRTGSTSDAVMVLSPGDDRVSELVVAAFDLNDRYTGDMRAIRAKALAATDSDPAGSSVRLLAVVGLEEGDAAAVLAANLGVVFAQAGTATVVVDGGLGNPAMAALFRVPAGPGLAQSLDDPDFPVQAMPTAVPRLMVLPAGDASAAVENRLETRPIADLTGNWSLSGARQAIVSLPGMASRPTALANMVAGFDGVILVAQQGRTRMSAIRRVIDALDERGVPVLGSVIS